MGFEVPPLSEFQWNGTEAQQRQRTEDGLEPLAEIGRQSWQTLRDYIQSGVANVEIGDCNDPWVCPQCSAMRGKVHPIVNAPRLPLRECEAETGCRCWYRPAL